MSPSPRQPSEPDRGRPEQGEVELEAAESAQAEAQEAAQEQAEAPKPKPKRASRRKPKKGEGTAAQATGVDKDVAEAGESTETSEPAVEPEAEESGAEPVASEPGAEEAVVERAEAPDGEPTEAPAAEAAAERVPRGARRRRRRGQPAPAPAAGGDGAAPVIVRAQARFVRSSARKARLVSEHIRGKTVEDARAILAHAQRDVARDWVKLLESAVANAEHNHELLEDDLHIHAAFADEGPTLKRYQPRAMGRATRIRKRTSHLTLTLAPKGGNH